MLTQRKVTGLFFRVLLVVSIAVGGVVSQRLSAQRSVATLTTTDPFVAVRLDHDRRVSGAERFTFDRRLISFVASVDGQEGRYILDTGAPGLILNIRERKTGNRTRQGWGTGGSVPLSEHRIEQFEMGGRTVNNYWAAGLDLRALEARTQQRIDGFVGYDLINNGELRIDYRNRSFRINRSRRRPQHAGTSPVATLKFTLYGHLPLVGLRIAGKLHYFIIDTGAGANVLDASLVDAQGITPLSRVMNIQGLDGRPVDRPVVEVRADGRLEGAQFVAMDLTHLAEGHGCRISGILGSPFLSQYTIGLDYRRQKLHLW